MANVNAKEIMALLFKYRVPLIKWGQGQTKTFNHLITELQKEECELIETFGKLNRKIRSLFIDVYYTDPENQKKYHLVEKEQIFKSGQRRVREHLCSVAEKLKMSEDPDKLAVGRALLEELKVHVQDRQIMKIDMYKTLSHSRSYPGIETLNEVHCYNVYFSQKEFRPEGYIEYQEDKTNYFVWVEYVSRKELK